MEKQKQVKQLKEKVVYCPKCGRYMFQADGKGTIPIDKKCKNCNILVAYDPLSDNVQTLRVPQRQSSSGMRFY